MANSVPRLEIAIVQYPRVGRLGFVVVSSDKQSLFRLHEMFKGLLKEPCPLRSSWKLSGPTQLPRMGLVLEKMEAQKVDWRFEISGVLPCSAESKHFYQEFDKFYEKLITEMEVADARDESARPAR